MEMIVRNVNQAFGEIFWKLKVHAPQTEQTRNGPALVINEPVITVYQNPAERVLFHPGRDANPIFHLMESIWILAGRRDVAFLQQFNSRIGQYSDDGKVFNAAYGYRLRHHFGFDQLVETVKLLRRDPQNRQAVMQIWDPADLNKTTKDKACNTEVLFDTRGGRLNMTVFNRSNDIWWGAYGANAVHFSVLQEFVARSIRFEMGEYRQVSNNLHLYTELYAALPYVAEPPFFDTYDHYSAGQVITLPLMTDANYEVFLDECAIFCDDPFNLTREYACPFFTYVARPMAMVSRVRKTGAGDGMSFAVKIRAEDWRRAVLEWLFRRNSAKVLANQ